jgi:hypothetical protein
MLLIYLLTVVVEFFFSPDGQILYLATTSKTGKHTWNLSLHTFSFPFDETNFKTAEFPTILFKVPKQPWFFPTVDLNSNYDPPCSLAWTKTHLYAVLGTCELRVCRIPLLQDICSVSQDGCQIQALVKNTFLPFSAAERGFKFSVNIIDDKEQAIFVLGPSIDLPAVVLIKDLVDESGPWVDAGTLNDHLETDSYGLDYMKGKYAAREQKFSISVRSGLAWRRQAFLSCW